ncbi:NRAMP family divalent metal transporter [Candidatus Rariloculus sp.]|uniref:NRAMP family divalent metal transporter n=1 Tax=Candidatus Rariloculus sp. TaxID=3101265 RepID=UPI003D0E1EB3
MNARSIGQRLGPGLIYAAAAVGVSHLVQATRAGGDYGFAMIPIIIVIALIKYPGIRFGGDYAVATGRTLIHSYTAISVWVTMIYAAIILLTMAFVSAAIVLVVNGLLQSVLGFSATDFNIAAVLLGVTGVLLFTGKYRLLESLNKLVVPAFTVLIFGSTIMLAFQTGWTAIDFALPAVNAVLIMYIVQLAGWMLTPMDGSVLQSLWTAAKSEQLGRRFSAAESQLDFNLGYAISLVLALCFLVMGASVLYGSGIEVAAGSGPFATQVIGLFSTVIGEWSFPLIGLTALLVMYSTLLTVLDGFARNLATLADIALPLKIARRYEIAVVIIVVSAIAVIGAFMRSFTTFIDFAGALTFLLAPLYAGLNHRAMFFSPEVPDRLRPNAVLKIWSIFGIVVMSVVAVLYVYLRWVS